MKRSYIIGLVLIGVAIAVIISTYSDASTYADFAQARERDEEIHVVGELVEGKPLHYDPLEDANYFTFYLKDKSGAEGKVVFRGSKPQDFERAEQIVLVGKMAGDEFHASKILMKCPSKYNENDLEVQEFSAES